MLQDGPGIHEDRPLVRISFQSLLTDLQGATHVPSESRSNNVKSVEHRRRFLRPELVLVDLERAHRGGPVSRFQLHDSSREGKTGVVPVEPLGLIQGCKRLGVPAQAFVREGTIPEQGVRRSCLLAHPVEVNESLLRLALSEADERQVSPGASVRRISLEGLSELTGRFLHRSGPVGGQADPEVLLHGSLGLVLSHALTNLDRKSGLDQTVQCLSSVELDESGIFDQIRDRAPSVYQRDDPLLVFRELEALILEGVPFQQEDEIHGRDLLLDHAPLVHPTRPLHEEGIDADRDLKFVLLRHDLRLELERPFTPLKNHVDGFMDLHGDVLLQRLLRHVTQLNEHLTQSRSGDLVLCYRRRELLLVDDLVGD